MTGRLLAGIDVGGSKIAVLVTDEHLRPVGRRVSATATADESDAVGRIVAVLQATLEEADRAAGELLAIGVGVPGRVDPVAGTVTLAMNLGWRDLPLGPRLSARFGVPVAVENDVRAAAAGLHARGIGGNDIAYLSIGTGISAGVVLGGRLHRGPRGLAGEIGHVIHEADGPRCRCGLRGCLEAIASGRAVGELAQAAIDKGAPSSLAGCRDVTAVDVYRAAAEGDPLALRITEAAGRHVARAVLQLVMAYDVRRVVLGGGVTAAGPSFREPVERGLDELRAASELAREALPADVVDVLPPGADAGAWGALILARSAARVDTPDDAAAGAEVTT